MADQSAARALLQQLESLSRAGITHLDRRAVLAVTAVRELEAGRKLVAGSAGQEDSTIARQDVKPTQTHTAQPGKDAIEMARSRTIERPTATSPAVPIEPTAKLTAAQPASVRLANTAVLAKVQNPFGPLVPKSDRPAALTVIRTEVAGCTRCPELAATRTQTVFGAGNPNARLCFLGEAPGADEDATGEPFVGRAGKLLTDIITKGMKLRREDVYILNVLKCRPPGNRPPEPNEVTNCRGYLDRQLEIIRPEFMCCLGAVAAKTLLNTEVSIGKLRGKFHDYRGIPVLCTYHPAYLLRNPAAKKDVWADLQVLMQEMGLSV